jgi:hypothetical protein
VHELQQLHGELDVPQPAGPELELDGDLVGGDVAGDPFSHALHGADEVLPAGAGPHPGCDRLDVPCAEVGVPGEGIRLQQRLELPALGPPVVVGDVRLEGPHQRPRFALGAQVGVDLPEFGFQAGLVEPAHHQHREPGGDVDGPARFQAGALVALRHEDDVHIADVVELAGAGLAHADHGEFGQPDLLHGIDTGGGDGAADHPPGHGEGRFERGGREMGELPGDEVESRDGVCLFQVVRGQFGQATAVPHPQGHPAVVLEECGEPVGGVHGAQ